MEFRARRRVTVLTPLEAEEESHDVQLYKRPPSETVSLAELESAALERLRVLRLLESAGVKSGARPGSAEWSDAVLEALRGAGLKDYWRSAKLPGSGKSESEVRARCRDRLAHFALRLAFCRSERLQRWFSTREVELLRLRVRGSGSGAALRHTGLPYSPIDADERERLVGRLSGGAEFYKVPFLAVPELVRTRRVYLEAGFAYVPSNEIVSVIASYFRTHLGRQLAEAARRLPRVESDERIVALLRGLHQSYEEVDYDSKSALPLDKIDSYATESFAPCMRSLHEHLRTAHHMKHGGRLQYGLFLKAAGLSLDDAMKFWRDEFTKIVDSDKFDKMYAYNVRYNYGKEGSKKNYSAYGCGKIIQAPVGPGDNHGCPFKHWDASVLKNKLLSYGVNANDSAEIADLATKGHHQIACGRYFDVMHGTDMKPAITHPNQYFEESRNIINGVVGKLIPAAAMPESNEWNDDDGFMDVDMSAD